MPVDQLHNPEQVKLLLLFILRSLGQPLSKAALAEACLGSETADIFLVAPAINDLLSSGHLVEDPDNDLVVLTPLGAGTSDELSRRLPLSVRERAVAMAASLARMAVRAEQIRAAAAPCEGGYEVTLGITDGDITLFSLNMFSPTEVQAHIMCDNFRRAPERLYTDILKALTAVRE